MTPNFLFKAMINDVIMFDNRTPHGFPKKKDGSTASAARACLHVKDSPRRRREQEQTRYKPFFRFGKKKKKTATKLCTRF